MDVYTSLLKILATPATILLLWLLKEWNSDLKQKIKEVKDDVKTIHLKLEKQENLLTIQKIATETCLDRIKEIKDSHLDLNRVVPQLKMELITIHKLEKETEDLKQSHGKILLILDKIVHKKN